MNNIYHQSIRVLSSGPITGLTGQLRPQLVEMIVDSIVASSASTNEAVSRDRDLSKDAADQHKIT